MKTTAILMMTLAGAAAAQDHNHLTVNTDGTTTSINAGYLVGETDWGIDGGYVTYQGEIAEYHTHDFHDGFHFGLAATLTSDFFAATGNLDGGDFYYEIVDFTAVDGGSATEAFWGEEAHGGNEGFEIIASSLGATRLDRSFRVGFAGHPHDQVTGVNGTGVYDITLVAWDASGIYADSAPVTLRLEAVPAPASAALLGLAALGASRRRR
jgi:hypothetical protein